MSGERLHDKRLPGRKILRDLVNFDLPSPCLIMPAYIRMRAHWCRHYTIRPSFIVLRRRAMPTPTAPATTIRFVSTSRFRHWVRSCFVSHALVLKNWGSLTEKMLLLLPPP